MDFLPSCKGWPVGLSFLDMSIYSTCSIPFLRAKRRRLTNLTINYLKEKDSLMRTVHILPFVLDVARHILYSSNF